MATSMPTVTLHNLFNSDGSALYTSPRNTCTLQSSVHYPLEVSYRSDEKPIDTYIEVSLRPHNGVAMVKERHIEELVRRTLKTTVLGKETPRGMLQVTVQVMGVETDEELSGGIKGGGQGEGYLDLLVGAINASILGCLDAGVQMEGVIGAVLVGISVDGRVILGPNVKERKKCSSLHAFAFNSRSQCILMDSQGAFDIDEWEKAEEVARDSICGVDSKPAKATQNGDIEMSDKLQDNLSFMDFVRKTFTNRVSNEEKWKL